VPPLSFGVAAVPVVGLRPVFGSADLLVWPLAPVVIPELWGFVVAPIDPVDAGAAVVLAVPPLIVGVAAVPVVGLRPVLGSAALLVWAMAPVVARTATTASAIRVGVGRNAFMSFSFG